MAGVGFARPKNRGRPFRLVRSVRILLGLKADGGTVAVHNSFLTCYGSVQEVAGIDLHARFAGIFLQHNSCLWAVNLGGKDGVIALGVKNPVVIEALAVADLLAVRVDVVTDQLGLSEIKRSTFNGSALYLDPVRDWQE